MAGLRIVRPGLLTTVQDLGRPALGRFGVSPSGAMDPLALRVANRLLGNPDGAPALELTGPGAQIAFEGEALFVVAGADLGATLDGAPVSRFLVTQARPGQTLRFSTRSRGARAVLAVAGGLDVPLVLGSAATDLDAGLGLGRLAAGQQLAVAASARQPRPPDPFTLATVIAAYDDPFRLRFVPEEDPAIPPETRARFVQSPFSISDRSNRTGYRLSLPPAVAPLLAPAHGERLSEPVAFGAIQLPPDGRPIVLMADRQTTGGYPRLGHLASVDGAKAAQLWPGDEICFVPVSVDEAHRAACAAQAALGRLAPPQ